METRETLYIQIYNYYKNLIIDGKLKPGSKIPSIRKCAKERMISRTTVETAYLQLSAEGYIASKAGSGFFVCDINYNQIRTPIKKVTSSKESKQKPLYDFASYSVDSRSFDFNLWSRYIKSALRNKDRLLYYGDTKGEYDLRVAISHYISEHRGVICDPEQIVIGAGVQSLLQILCSLTVGYSPVAFTGVEFVQGRVVFRDRGFETVFSKDLISDLSCLNNIKPKIIYISPSHMTPWGDVMPIQKRFALLSYAKENGVLIIEDDYDSEFRYYIRPVPSLQSLDGGQNVVYMGTFSRLLLPSVRISFMVLPSELVEEYNKHGEEYNQTASKMEQIALCQFIRDGHIDKQIKKTRKLYLSKSNLFCEIVKKVFDDKATAIPSLGGFLIQLEIKSQRTSKELVQIAANEGILLKPLESYKEDGYPRVLLCLSGVSVEDFEKVLIQLKDLIYGDG